MTNTRTNTGSRPTHHIYAVRKLADGKGSWTEIGAAWPNRDGKGFNIKLNLLPLDGSEIVMREPKDEHEAAPT